MKMLYGLICAIITTSAASATQVIITTPLGTKDIAVQVEEKSQQEKSTPAQVAPRRISRSEGTHPEYKRLYNQGIITTKKKTKK